MKGIRSRLKTLNNWLERVCCYGFRNSLMLYRNLKRNVTFSVRHYGYDFYLRGNTVDFPVFNGIFARGEYDFTIDFMPEFIIDAGAFIGASSVYFSHRFPGAKIVALEPEETNYALLAKNAKPFENIIPVQVALYGEDTSVRITDPSAEKYAFRVEPGEYSDSGLSGFSVETVMKRYELPRIDILKMDIEGAEYEVFSGESFEWLMKTRLLIIEIHEHIKPGVTEIILKALETRNFEIQRRGENFIAVNKRLI